MIPRRGHRFPGHSVASDGGGGCGLSHRHFLAQTGRTVGRRIDDGHHSGSDGRVGGPRRRGRRRRHRRRRRFGRRVPRRRFGSTDERLWHVDGHFTMRSSVPLGHVDDDAVRAFTAVRRAAAQTPLTGSSAATCSFTSTNFCVNILAGTHAIPWPPEPLPNKTPPAENVFQNPFQTFKQRRRECKPAPVLLYADGLPLRAPMAVPVEGDRISSSGTLLHAPVEEFFSRPPTLSTLSRLPNGCFCWALSNTQISISGSQTGSTCFHDNDKAKADVLKIVEPFKSVSLVRKLMVTSHTTRRNTARRHRLWSLPCQ